MFGFVGGLCAVLVSTPTAEVREFLGPEALAVLESFHEMEILAFEPPWTGARAPYGAPLSSKRLVSTDVAERLARLFLDGRTYRFDHSRDCDFVPSQGLRLNNGLHRLELLFSFECNLFRLTLYDREGRFLLRKEEDFDRSRRRLRRLLTRARRRPADRRVIVRRR